MNAYISVFTIVLNLIQNYFLIFVYGIVRSAYATAITYVVSAANTHTLALKYKDEIYRKCFEKSSFIFSGKVNLATWAISKGIEIMCIQLGDPQQNSYVESHNRTVMYDWLNHYLFGSIKDTQNRATKWLWICNNKGPKMALNGIKPIMKLAVA
jgi:transposase InsO family protein